jgi:hypothetical protein
MTGPLLSKKITYKTFLTVRWRLAILGRFEFLMAQILFEHFHFGSK